jgi:hypothetical protein
VEEETEYQPVVQLETLQIGDCQVMTEPHGREKEPVYHNSVVGAVLDDR